MKASVTFVMIGAAALGGCAHVELPSCPSIARSGGQNDAERQSFVSGWARSRADALNIKIVELSPYVARYSGSKSSLRKLQSNFPQMLCAFDYADSSDPVATYTSCLAHAPEWIVLTSEGKADDLMLSQYYYRDNCLTPP